MLVRKPSNKCGGVDGVVRIINLRTDAKGKISTGSVVFAIDM